MQQKRPRKIRSSFAHDINQKEITIQAATSGRRGYFCPDCKRIMEAVKPLQEKPRPYFRHVATDVQIDQHPCTYSDESYRHRIAKEILIRTKSIKLPKVPKYPPKGFDGPIKQVAPPRTIVAFDVQVERDFYEDENQNLHWGRFDGSEKRSLVRPDVIFFDSKGIPILFIELVATHKPDFQKLEKIKRLGIDTVTVKVPTESSEAIEECFSNTYNTKWFFSNGQERADYFQLPGSFAQRISDVDRIQRRLFEETVICRQNRIRNLVRAFDACIRSESYKRIESGIRTEISELDNEASKHKRFESEIDSEVYGSFGPRRAETCKRQDKLERVCRYFKRKEEGLEDDVYNELLPRRRDLTREATKLNRIRFSVQERYERKGRQLEEEETEFTRFHGIQDQNSDGEGKDIDLVEERIRGEIRTIESAIGRIKEQIGAIQEQLDAIQVTFERERNRIIEKFDQEAIRMENHFKGLESQEVEAFDLLEREEEEFQSGTGPAREGVIRRFEGDRSDAIESIKRRNTSGDSLLSRKIKDVVSTGEQLVHYQSALKTYERYTEALRYLNTEAFKTWIKNRRIL